MRLTTARLNRIISEETRKILREAEAAPEKPKAQSVSYTGVVLDQASHDSLKGLVPEGWDDSKTRHHVTLNMGPWKGDPDLLGKKVKIDVLGFAKDDKVAAVKVSLGGDYTVKGTPHITIATGPGGKPFMAGKLDYSKLEEPEGMPRDLSGVVKEVPEGDYSLAESGTRSGSVIVERWQRLAGIIR